MSNLQIKNMDDGLHARLRARADRERVSMRDYVLDLIERDLARPSLSEWLEELRALPVLDVGADTAALVRTDREERTDTVLAAEARASYADRP